MSNKNTTRKLNIYNYLLTAALLLLSVSCNNGSSNKADKYKDLTERFFREVYGINPSVVD